MLTSPTPTGYGSDPLIAPATLSFSWTPDANQYHYCLEGWHKPANSENIAYLGGYKDVTYGGETAKAQHWTATTGTSATFSGLAEGHYTMHVRSTDGVYEANLTYLVKAGTSTTTTKRGGSG
jgi:hypothetical protein